MRWPEVWQAMALAMESRTEITDIVGGAIYLDGPVSFRTTDDANRGFEVPSINGVLIADEESQELFEDNLFQIDVWARTLPQAIRLEQVIRWLFHHDVRVTIQGVRMWMFYEGGRTVTGPGHDRYFGRSLDFSARPIRTKYVRVTES